MTGTAVEAGSIDIDSVSLPNALVMPQFVWERHSNFGDIEAAVREAEAL